MEEQKRQAEREMNEMKEKMEKMKSAVAGKSEVQKKTGQSTIYKVSNIELKQCLNIPCSYLNESRITHRFLVIK